MTKIRKDIVQRYLKTLKSGYFKKNIQRQNYSTSKYFRKIVFFILSLVERRFFMKVFVSTVFKRRRRI